MYRRLSGSIPAPWDESKHEAFSVPEAFRSPYLSPANHCSPPEICFLHMMALCAHSHQPLPSPCRQKAKSVAQWF